jgi:hypothetical protein
MLTTFDLEVERFYLRIGVQIKLIQKIAIAIAIDSRLTRFIPLKY